MFEPIRGFTSLQRTPQSDLKLGSVLAFVAGAINAGGGCWRWGNTPRT